MARMFSRVGGKDNPGGAHRMGAETSADGTLAILGEPGSGVILTEKSGSRAVELTPTGARMIRLFDIVGEVDTIVAQTIGPPVGSLFPGGLRAVKRNTSVATDQIRGDPVLLLQVDYEREQDPGSTFLDRDDFRISGETVQIKQVKSDADAKHFPPSSKASEDGRTIGLANNRTEAEGVAVLDPILGYTATRFLDDITTDEIRAITELQGKVNKGDFYGFPEGEVLYLGGNIIDMRDQGVFQVRHEFQIRFNRTDSPLEIFLLGDAGSGAGSKVSIPKEGWQYLTFNLSQKPGDVAASRYAHVWNVFEKGAFIGSLPGLGTETPWENRPAFPPILSSPPATAGTPSLFVP